MSMMRIGPAWKRIEERARRLEDEKRAEEVQRLKEREAAEARDRLAFEAADAALRDHFAIRAVIPVERPYKPAKEIIHEIATKYRISLHDIKGHCRRAAIVRARHEACYRLRTETPMSYPQIGRHLGNRDHTTIFHGAHKYAATHGLPIDGTNARHSKSGPTG